MMKIKQLLPLASVILLSMSCASHAKSLVCPFNDYFTLSMPGNGTIIGTPTVTGNLKYTQQGSNFFILSCGNNDDRGSGDLSISVGYNDENLCKLSIHDGPYVMNPSVDANCQGYIKYDGMDHVYGSYNYTLKFK